MKKTGSKGNLNQVPAHKLHKPVIKKFKNIKSMQGLKITLGLQIWLKWGHYPLRIEMLNIYCA